MTDRNTRGRKPPGVSWESWIEKQIREAGERGEFDNLPGAGKPIEGLGERDESWWIRNKLKREGLEYLPPSLRVRKELEETRARIADATDEAEVRTLVAAINERIRWVNHRPGEGPPSTLMPLDVDEVVARWRAARP